MTKLQKNAHFDSDPKGLTLIELLVVIAVLLVFCGITVVSYSKLLSGKTLEGTTENIASLIRAAQLRAQDTQIVQILFLCKNEILWAAFPDKNIEEATSLVFEDGEQIRKLEFPTGIEIAELWTEDEEIKTLPKNPTVDIALFINEKGIMAKADIAITKERDISWISVSGRQVITKKADSHELAIIVPFEPFALSQINLNTAKEALLCETEELVARGWQTVQINNVDETSEVKLRIKSNSRIPELIHFHACVFPGTYQNKRIAHGMNMGDRKVPLFTGRVLDADSGEGIVAAYVEASSGQLTLSTTTYSISGMTGMFEFAQLPIGIYTFKAEHEEYHPEIVPNVLVNYEHTYLEIKLNPGGGGSPGLSSGNNSGQFVLQESLGEWDAEYNLLTGSASPVNIAVFAVPKLHYLYKDTTKMSTNFMTEYPTYGTPAYKWYHNLSLNNGFSLYPPSGASTSNIIINTGYSTFPYSSQYLKGPTQSTYAYSKLSSQPIHNVDIQEEEIEPGGYSSWLTIATKDLPKETKFLRIAIAAYSNKDNEHKIFNLYPTANSKHPQEKNINSSLLDYQTDPFAVMSPWLKWVDSPLWLSNYGYMLKPLTRPSSNNVLAAKGPYFGENYEEGSPYKKFWYGPVFLDWDKLLGEEGILSLLGWVSTAFGFDQWPYTQRGDTYSPQHPQNYLITTHKAAPSHYWLKTFGMLSYWHIFNYSSLYPPEDVPKRVQLPLNTLLDKDVNAFPVWERFPCNPYPYESSSLSIELMQWPRYPIFMPALMPLFGQARTIYSADLYASYFYLMERINHIMLDTAAWIFRTGNSNQKQAAVKTWSEPPFHFNGNLDKWRLEEAQVNDGTGLPYPRATWWNWYTSIPWTKGVAFPVPGTMAPREGWEAPQVEPPPPDDLFARGINLNPDYNNILKNQPSTIFMSTAHYPLGKIQVAVKKK